MNGVFRTPDWTWKRPSKLRGIYDFAASFGVFAAAFGLVTSDFDLAVSADAFAIVGFAGSFETGLSFEATSSSPTLTSGLSVSASAFELSDCGRPGSIEIKGVELSGLRTNR